MMTLNSLLVEPLADGDKPERSDRKESDPSKFEELHDDKQGHRLSSEEGVSSPDNSEEVEDDDGEEASSEGEMWMDSSERARLAYYEGRYEDVSPIRDTTELSVGPYLVKARNNAPPSGAFLHRDPAR